MRYIFIMLLFGIYTNLSSQVKLTQVESDTVLYRIPVAHRTIAGQPGKYFMKYMGLEPLMDSLDLKGTKIDSMTFASDTLKLYTSDGIFKVEILAGGGGSGTVTSIATTSPITGGPITTSGTIGINTANTSTTGALTSADWNTFNDKIGGSGTTNQFSYFSGTNTLTSSSIFSFNTHGVTLQKGTWNAFINGGNNTLSGTGNIAIGSNQTLSNLTSGSNNAAFGTASGNGNTTGSNNYYAGNQSGYSNSTGSNNLFVGANAGYGVTLGDNVYIGASAGQNATSSTANTILGSLAGYSGGSSNVDIGFYSGFGGTGNYNTRLGRQAGQNAGTSNGNIYIGYAAGQNNTGSNNLALGYQAGATGDGSTNVFIGYQAGFSETGSNTLYLTNNSGTSSGIFGSYATGLFGVNQAPSAMTNTFDINGTLRVRTTNTVTPTTLIGRDANGVLAGMSLGTGLAITTGTLNFTETDGSITNEGYQGVTAGSGTSSVIQGYNSAGTATGTGTTINAGGSISISETANVNGGQITLTGDYGAFSVAATTGGSGLVGPLDGDPFLTFTAGSGMTITRSGTTGDNQTLTFASTGGTTNLSYSTKSGTDVTLESSTGADVILRDGVGTIVNRVSANVIKYDNDAPYTYMNQIAGTTALTTTDAKIALSGDAASNGDALTTDYDNTNDEIDIAVTGTYEIGFSCNCKSNTAARAVIFSIKNNVTSTLVGFVKSYYFTNTDEYCETNFEYPVALSSGARLSLYAKTGGSTTSITDCNISMYARRVK